jgi:hypothetical protein
MLRVVGSCPGGGFFLYNLLSTLLYPCCVVTCPKVNGNHNLKHICRMKMNWFFSGKYSGKFLKKFHTNFSEKIPANSLINWMNQTPVIF